MLCFNPHTHAGCDSSSVCWWLRSLVSIHTPTQGVTAITILHRCEVSVSIHTPTQGVTLWEQQVFMYKQCFNPHTHAGCDLRHHFPNISKAMVSIHTPTQGVTNRLRTENQELKTVSIHTPTQGVTENQIILFHRYIVSIHTPTQGVTMLTELSGISLPVSIHTPTQGVTYGSNKYSCTSSVSIHTPTQGVTKRQLRSMECYSVSIHTPTQGVTLYLITYYKSANLIHCYANHHYYSTS